MRVVIAGASGFLGQAFSEHLLSEGHTVTRLVRRPAGPGESQWDPYAGTIDLEVIDAADVAVNLAGAPLTKVPFSKSYRTTFRASRVVTTRALADAVARVGGRAALLAQNGTAGYGDRGDQVITEDVPIDADTFLGQVTRDWQAATASASDAGARVVVMRTSVVLAGDAMAVKFMKVPFLLGLGGPIGNGQMYFPTISLADWLRAATFLAESTTATGAYNVSGPEASTNAEYTRALADRLHRPAFLRVPTWPLQKLLGPMAPELLNSQRVEPARLVAEGFVFEHPTVRSRVAAALPD